MHVRPSRLLAIAAGCAAACLALAPSTVMGAVSTVSLPGPYSATALDSGAVLLSDASPSSALSGLRLKLRDQAALTPVTVVGDDAAVLGIAPLAGGRALISAATLEQYGPWVMSPAGTVEQVALGVPGSAVRRATYSVVDDITPGGTAVGRWETSPLDDDPAQGIWMLDASGPELRTKVAPPAFENFGEEVLEDQVVTESGRIVALAVRDYRRIVARVLEPGASTWSAVQVIDEPAEFSRALYFKDDAQLAVGRDGTVVAAWSARYADTGELVRQAQLAPGTAGFGTPTTVGPDRHETELTPAIDPAGDLLVGVRTRSARGVFADEVFTGGPSGPFASIGAGLVVEHRNVRGELLMSRATPSGPTGWVVRTRRGPGTSPEQRDLNTLLGAGPTAIKDVTLDDSGDSAVAWVDGTRLLASRVSPGQAPDTDPIACGASTGQVALTSGRVAALASRTDGHDVVAFSSATGWRSISLPGGGGPGTGDWTLTRGSTGDLVVLRSAESGTTAVLSTAAGSDGQPLAAEGFGCEGRVAGVTLRVTPTRAGDLDVLVRCGQARDCAGTLVATGAGAFLPLAIRGVRVGAGAEGSRVLRIPASVRARVIRGAVRPTVTLYGPWGRVAARARLAPAG